MRLKLGSRSDGVVWGVGCGVEAVGDETVWVWGEEYYCMGVYKGRNMMNVMNQRIVAGPRGEEIVGSKWLYNVDMLLTPKIFRV